MRLAAIYNVFDGEELLQGSINQIREHCDYVIAVVQNVSNHGNKYEGGCKEVARLQRLGLIDRVHYYKPKLDKNPTWNETKKRNEGLEIAKILECTHFISMDCDEYYLTHEFASAKAVVYLFNLQNTVCKIYTYFGSPNYMLVPMESYSVQFISEVRKNTKLGNFDNGHYCDPTRKTGLKAMDLDFIRMHHYSWVRKDISRKIDNSSANINLKKYKDELIEAARNPKEGMELPFYKGHKLVKTSDHFNANRIFESTNEKEPSSI